MLEDGIAVVGEDHGRDVEALARHRPQQRLKCVYAAAIGGQAQNPSVGDNRLSNSPVRGRGFVLKFPDDRKNRVVST